MELVSIALQGLLFPRNNALFMKSLQIQSNYKYGTSLHSPPGVVIPKNKTFVGNLCGFSQIFPEVGSGGDGDGDRGDGDDGGRIC